MLRLLCIALCSVYLISASSVFAEVKSKPCPFNCEMAGFKKNCKDWKEGNTCYVEAKGKGKGKGKNKRQAKNVTSKQCPYNCKMAGLGENKCKDWKKGDKCFVQKL